MAKILFVDDEVDMEPLMRQWFRKSIREGEYEFFFAHNGIEALEILENQIDIDLIISDINMPDMDGLTLLEKIQEKNLQLKSVIVSAYGDMENIRTAMNRGAFDFVTKPVDFEDLEATIKRGLEQISLIRSALHTKEKLITVEKEISIAAALQQSILPRDFPENKHIDLKAVMIPAADVGGDFYDFFWLDEHKLALVVADVSGKGITAGLFMAVSRTFLKSLAPYCQSPSECLRRVNLNLCKDNDAFMFVTLFYGVLDLRTFELSYANAGHCPALLWNDKEASFLPTSSGIALGILEEASFEDHLIQLKPNDRLLLYTDGVTEAMNEDHEEYSSERLLTVVKGLDASNMMELLEGVVADIRNFAGKAPQSDDITALAFRMMGDRS